VLSYEDLLRVRYAKWMFGPEGKMYWINKVNGEPDIRSAVAQGIKKTVYEMIKIPFPLIGVKGIRWMSRDIKKWPRKHGMQKAAFYLGQVLRMSEDFGTGGAGFRYIFGEFLRESGEKFNHEGLLEASAMMGKTANRWRELNYVFARSFKNRSTPEQDYNMFGDMMFEIAGLEEQVYKKLDKIVI